MKIFVFEYYLDAVEDHYEASVLANSEEEAISLIKDEHSLEAYNFTLMSEDEPESSSRVLSKTLLN